MLWIIRDINIEQNRYRQKKFQIQNSLNTRESAALAIRECIIFWKNTRFVCYSICRLLCLCKK